MMAMLEAEGRKVVGAPALKGERLLAQVLTTIRALAPQLGRRPTHLEIAEHASLSVDEVRHALTLAKIMQR